MSTLNWSELISNAAETANYEPLPDGDYDLTVKEATQKMTQSNKVMFSIKAEVDSGPHAKRLVWDNLVVSPENENALGIFFGKMAALGLTKENFFSQGPTNAQIEAALGNRKFRAQIGSRTYNGQKRNEIKRYYRATEAAPGASAAVAAAPAPAPAPSPAPAPAPAPEASTASAPPSPF